MQPSRKLALSATLPVLPANHGPGQNGRCSGTRARHCALSGEKKASLVAMFFTLNSYEMGHVPLRLFYNLWAYAP